MCFLCTCMGRHAHVYKTRVNFDILSNMHISYTTVTWYSKLLSIIFFIAVVPVLTFYIGTEYQKTRFVTDQTNTPLVYTPISLKHPQKNVPKIDIGSSVLEGKVTGFVKEIYEKQGELWVAIDPAFQVSAAECVFNAYDTQTSENCESPNGTSVLNRSTSTISMPLTAKASVAVYYNDGTKIGLKPRMVRTTNGKLFVFDVSTTSVVSATSSQSIQEKAKSYNGILSFDGDDTYRWNPMMNLEIVQTVVGSTSRAEIKTIEEVWKP